MNRLPLSDGELWFAEDWVPPAEQDALYVALDAAIPWRNDPVRMFGRTTPIPRMHQWFADAGQTYRWSGITMSPVPWPPELLALRGRLEDTLSGPFPRLLANLYRDGQDTVGWHADDEPELGPTPCIASVSLGATRDFLLRHRTTGERLKVPLTSGSLLVMAGTTQDHWVHALPRRKRVTTPRINLTFRGPPRHL